jgi:hypothetical protein
MRVTSDQVVEMLREAQENWPRLGRMQCGELADIATTTTRILPDICRDWRDMQARLSRYERVVQAAKDAGPFPVIANVPWHDGAVQECQHCLWGAGKHAPDCPGMELREALAALTPARDETAVGDG